MTESKRHRLERTGAPPLVFTGKQVAREIGRHGDLEVQRFHDITVYQTRAGQLVAHVEYLTLWRGEHGYAWTTQPSKDPAEIVAELQGYDPVQYVQGFPDDPKYAGRQANLTNHVLGAWDEQLTAIIATLGVEEEIE